MIRVYANIPGYLHGFLDDLLGSEIRLVDQGSGSSCGIIERERENILIVVNMIYCCTAILE